MAIDLVRGRAMRRRMDLQSALRTSALALSLRIQRWMLVVSGMLAACTDPSAVGPEPEFIALVDISGFVSPGVAAPRPLSPDQCPEFIAALQPSDRRSVPGSDGATIALPAGAGVKAAGFAAGSGVIFAIPEQGYIAISYDTMIGTPLRLAGPSQRADPTAGLPYTNACAFTIDGRAAKLYFATIPSRVGAASAPQLLPVMAVTTTTPAGRPVNVRLIPNALTGFDGGSVALLRLLPWVGTLQW